MQFWRLPFYQLNYTPIWLTMVLYHTFFEKASPFSTFLYFFLKGYENEEDVRVDSVDIFSKCVKIKEVTKKERIWEYERKGRLAF